MGVGLNPLQFLRGNLGFKHAVIHRDFLIFVDLFNGSNTGTARNTHPLTNFKPDSTLLYSFIFEFLVSFGNLFLNINFLKLLGNFAFDDLKFLRFIFVRAQFPELFLLQDLHEIFHYIFPGLPFHIGINKSFDLVAELQFAVLFFIQFLEVEKFLLKLLV